MMITQGISKWDDNFELSKNIFYSNRRSSIRGMIEGQKGAREGDEAIESFPVYH